MIGPWARRAEIWWLAPSLLLLAVTACDGQTETLTPLQTDIAEVPVFGTADIMLHAGSSYDARAGLPNPYDVHLSAMVRSPSGVERRVFGFFDGDGQGGPVGDVFRLRIQPDEPGSWSWTVDSELEALDGREGTFEARGRLEGAFEQGGVVVAADAPRFFSFQRGLPVFLIGKFLDVDAPEPIRYSHTFFSEELSDANRRQMLERHLAMGLNKMNVYMANRGDYGGALPTTPWIGSAESNDKDRFALDRWHMYEQWITELRAAGVVAQLWFFADDSEFGSLGREEQERLVSYGMARLSAYVNTMFVLMLEWQEGWSRERVESLGALAQDHNPWGRLVSAHGLSGDFAFPDSEWADFMDVQAGFGDANNVLAFSVRNRELAHKPLMHEEFSLGEETAENRRMSWAAFLSGAAGIGTGAFLRPLSDFVSSIPFATLEPSPDLVTSGTAYASSNPGFLYVAYLPSGGRVELDLTASPGQLAVTWYDPRTGSELPDGLVQAGQVASFDTPDARDWALVLERR